MQANPFPSVPYGRGGQVSTRHLETLLPHAQLMRDGRLDEITPVAAQSLLQNTAAIIEELVHRRRAMEVAVDFLTEGNVIFLAPGDPSDG